MISPRPILSSLRRHKIAALLIILETALAFAIVSNALYMVVGRLERVRMPSGIDERSLVMLRLDTSDRSQGTVASGLADVAALRTIPGVESATVANSMPLSGMQWGLSFSTRPMDSIGSGVGAPLYLGGPDLLKTFGVHVLAGSEFAPSAYADFRRKGFIDQLMTVHQALITKALAERLWPHGQAVGKEMYMGKTRVQVVGVVSNIIRPYVSADAHDPANYFAAIYPRRLGPDLGAFYVLRCKPADRSRILEAARAKLQALHPTETVGLHETFTRMRRHYFANDRSMAWLLVGTMLALLGVTAVGIVGLASFWVQQRTRQIGVRRALGACRADIRRYFQAENFLLATTGILIGCAAAIVINVWLMAHYSVPRLPVIYLPVGALLLVGIGQIAVLGPAIRAARVPPTRAMRAA